MRKRKAGQCILFAVVCLLLIQGFPLDVMAEPLDEEIQMDITGGFNGIAKLGAWVPIHVTVHSVNRNMTGEIQVETNLDQMRRIILAVPVELSPGVEQDIYFEIPVISAKKEINIRLVEKKKTISEKTYTFNRLVPPETMLIGILSEDPEAFSWLNGNTIPVVQSDYMDEKMKLMIASGQVVTSAVRPAAGGNQEFGKKEAVTVPLSRESFPDNNKVMDGFDYILISRFDTGLLNQKQVDTLETWVDTGGLLMLGTGLNWQKVYHGLPDGLKPFLIQGTKDINSTEILRSFTGRDASGLTLKTAYGNLGFDYISPSSDDEFKPGIPLRYMDNDIIVGDDENPLAIKYRKEQGGILVFTFDPSTEPFASWQSRAAFTDFALRYMPNTIQRFYNYGNGLVRKQVYDGNNLQNLANEVPQDKKPPFLWIFIGLLIYVILIGPVLYLILKKRDRRDWAWVWIPVLSIAFLIGMNLFGFKSRYHTAVMNTVSLIEISPEGNEALVSSSIGVFNDKRGTLKVEYENQRGIETPIMQNNEMYYRGYGEDTKGTVVAKLTMAEKDIFEQYDVMLWTANLFNARQNIPVDGDILKEVYLKDDKLMGSVTNTTPFDLLDAVIVVGSNIIPIGDVLVGDTSRLEISLDSPVVYKRPDEYLDGEFCRTNYNHIKDIPPDYNRLLRNRRIFGNKIQELSNIRQGKAQFFLLARNEQEIDYGLIVNDKTPVKYNHNLITTRREFVFNPGQEVEIPSGIIQANYYQTQDVGWNEGNYGIQVHNTGEMEFHFVLPEKLDVTELSLSIKPYIPLYLQYSIENETNNGIKTSVLSNQYEYALYNFRTHGWEDIEATTRIMEDVSRYIGNNGEVHLRVTVVKLGQVDEEQEQTSYVYRYEQEYLSMPEISLKGVAR